MADYNKQTVAQLRQLLKDRGIPSTGLTRKAQIVEKLEEADTSEGGNAPAEEEAEEAQTEELPSDSSPDEPNDDAPADLVAQVQEGNGQDTKEKKEDALGPPLSEAGEPDAPPIDESQTPVVPIATVDANRETVSHIDSDVPPPDRTKAIEHSAEDTTMDNEPGTIQPAGIFNAAPADPEDVVEPKITEPEDQEMEGDETEELAKDELPNAPGPAAEALRFARQEQELSRDAPDTPLDDKTSTPVTIEEPSLEKADLPTIPEQSTAQTSRLGTEEWEADSKKRKRRSGSPDLPYQDIKAKKPRPSQEPAPEVHLKEDEDVVMEQRGSEADVDGAAEVEEDLKDSHTTDADKPSRREKTDRYKSLVDPSASENPHSAIQDDRPIAPALHPATPALYIRNFMRPLRPESLRTHLISLASPPSSSPDSSIIHSLFLDSMKTHALVLFSSTSAASRVRAALHGSIWPPEGNRKELWVDFVPEDKIESWIKLEEDAILAEKEGRANGRPVAPQRFEVVYPDNATAIFQEVGAASASQAPADASRGSKAAAVERRLSQPVRQDIAASFQTLDQLFESTSAKPSLYYLPVADEIADARRKELETETSRDWAPGEVRKGRGLKTEMKYRYWFDGEGRVVEGGEDRGPWAEDLRGGRGGFRGRGRGGGGRGRGGWRG